MLQNKKTQIRQNIRKETLRSIFTLKRKELVEGRLSIFKELNKQIFSEKPSHQDEQLPHRIISCLKNYPDEENTYIVIGNYLLWNKHLSSNFFPLLTECPKYLEHQMWCYSIIAYNLDEMITVDRQDQEKKIEEMEEILASSCQIVQYMKQHLKRSSRIGQKQMTIWISFQQILKLQLNHNLFNQFPQESIALAQEILSILPVNEKNDEAYKVEQTWSLLKAIYEHIDEVDIRRDLFAVSWSIIWLILQQYPQERQVCIDFLTILLERYSVDFMQSLFHENIALQVLYIFDQVSALKPKIALFLKELLRMCNMEQMIFMISKGSHKLLTQTMEWSMQTCDNQCLQDCMTAIYYLLGKFKDFQEDRLVRRILSEVQEYHFDQMLSGMIQQPQNTNISKYLNLLIDDFYSEEESI